MSTHDSFNTRSQLDIDGTTYTYFSLPAAEQYGLSGISQLPCALKILLENLLRHEDGATVKKQDIQAVAKWLDKRTSRHEIAYFPARVLMQDFTGVPGIVDLAAMRDAMQALGGDPDKINPQVPVDLVIDHSVQVDKFAVAHAYRDNTKIEFDRNLERYQFLRWGQQAFANFRVVPPGTGICHQVNLEYLAKTVWSDTVDGILYAYPDTLVGTDSHTTMINALGVLGWGVGGIEAEASMLGQAISMLIPEVVGFKLTGQLAEGITATDLVLTVTQMLRQKGVVGKFVEFYGDGLNQLTLADRATIANMSPEYGATCGLFPIDQETIRYLTLTGRDEHTTRLVEHYAKAQGLWRDEQSPEPVFTDTLTLDLTTVEASLAGPKRPQDKVTLSALPQTMDELLKQMDDPEQGFSVDLNSPGKLRPGARIESGRDLDPGSADDKSENYQLHHGDVVIAAITSCTNTSNPSVLMAAGLLAKNALEKGLQRKPWVKSSLAPGSKVVTHYLQQAGLQDYLDQLGFNLVGYGCTTCIGNSGPLPDPITKTVTDNHMIVSSVLSGNRNFEGRIHPLVQANWLASPPLVVAYALAGTTRIDLSTDPLGQDSDGQDVYLKDIWPSQAEISEAVAKVTSDMFQQEYASVFKGDEHWQALSDDSAQTYQWTTSSTYIQQPPFFQRLTKDLAPIKPIQQAHILALLGDSITTDHISPAGNISQDSPAGHYLQAENVAPTDFNSYGSRRGNHQVMMRGTFGNIRIRNEMLADKVGGYTKHIPSHTVMPIYDAAMQYQADSIPLVVIAGKEYGTGSSRDWAAKGTFLLGVRAVIAESFERIHRSNLIGMGVLPLQFMSSENRNSLNLTGEEFIDIDINQQLEVGSTVNADIHYPDKKQRIQLLCRIDTQVELDYFRNGGILAYVLRRLL